MISQGLEDFLTYLRETEQQMHMAAQSEQEANDATQDILHRLELCDIDGETAETLALKLQAVRRANGLGCLRRISDKCTFGITDDLLRDILTGNASPTIKEWREIGRALDELEGKGAASE